MVGIRTTYRVQGDIIIANSTALIPVGLTSPIAANQRQQFRAWVPISVGATGGVRLQVVVPAGAILFGVSVKLYDTVAQSLTTAFQAASAAFNNALADAGDHWLEVEGEVENGPNAGTIDIQFAQDTADLLSLVIHQNGWMQVTVTNVVPLLPDFNLFQSAGLMFSLRQLSPTATKAVKVRRSSDNATQDIGFVNGVLDTATLLAFVGAGDGRVDTWYDQSPNGVHVSQSTPGKQPKLVVAGVLQTSNGKPAIWFDFFDPDFLDSTIPFQPAANYAAFFIAKSLASGTPTGALFTLYNNTNVLSYEYLGCATGGLIYRSFVENTIGSFFTASIAQSTPAAQSLLKAVLNSAGVVSLRNNGVLGTTATVTGTLQFPADTLRIGARTVTGGNQCNNFIAEAIVFNSKGDDATFQTNVENNLRDFYRSY